MRLLSGVLAAIVVIAAPAAQSPDEVLSDTRLSVHTLVREDIFAGFKSDNMARFERGERNIEILLTQRPEQRGNLLAWKAGTKLYRALLAHEAGQPEAFARLCAWGLVDSYRQQHSEPGRYTWWDYRAGNFHKNYVMRIDHLLVTSPVAARIVWAEIDREARKGKPIPSDHAPLVIDLDEPGHPFEAGWTSAEGRIAARRGGAR